MSPLNSTTPDARGSVETPSEIWPAVCEIESECDVLPWVRTDIEYVHTQHP